MEALIATAGLLTVGVITPGPNNLIVMRETAHGGWKRAVPAATGIVAGGLALLLAVTAGASALLTVDPRVILGMRAAACLVLATFGVRTIAGASRPASRLKPAAHIPKFASLGGLFVFQFLNPKAWVLTVTAVVSVQSSLGGATFPVLASLLALISTAGLILWSSFGLLLMRYQNMPVRRAWFDRVTGGLLIGFAFILLIGS